MRRAIRQSYGKAVAHPLRVITLAGIAVIFSACNGQPDRVADSDARPQDYRTVEQVLERNRESLMDKKGVVGAGIGADSESRKGPVDPKDEAHVIVVYLRSAEADAEVPDGIDGVPIRTTVTGEVRSQ